MEIVGVTAVTALLAAWAAYRRQKRLDRESTTRQWMLTAKTRKIEIEELKEENGRLVQKHLDDKVAIAELQIELLALRARQGSETDGK